MKNCAMNMALKDISEYFKSQNIKIQDEHGDIWVVTPNRMCNKENRKLNRQLGINKVNYTAKAMIRK